MTEKSFVIIKPDAVERNLIGKILDVYEKEGLVIRELKMGHISREFAEKHYEEHIGKVFFNNLINYITRSKVVALVLEGEDAISKIRRVNGATNPESAEIGTIRKMYAINKTENSVHASDSSESAKREISLWFPNS